MLNKKEQRLRRARQTRARIAQQRVVRLTVFRSNQHIYANVISDDGARVLASASTAEQEVRAAMAHGGSTAPALPTTAASRRWPRQPAKPACSSDDTASSQGIQPWLGFNLAPKPKATTTA